MDYDCIMELYFSVVNTLSYINCPGLHSLSTKGYFNVGLLSCGLTVFQLPLYLLSIISLMLLLKHQHLTTTSVFFVTAFSLLMTSLRYICYTECNIKCTICLLKCVL